MTYDGEVREILRMFVVAIVAVWPVVRAVFLVWAIVSVTNSLAMIARNLERLANLRGPEQKADHTGTKSRVVEPETIV